MKTKIIPFNLELAKKIQAGEAEGKIKTKNGRDVDILCFDRKSASAAPIVAIIHVQITEDEVHTYSKLGYVSDIMERDYLTLVLEVPDNEPQFKPFDRVLVRDEDNDIWNINFFSHSLCENNGHNNICLMGKWRQCIPYEGHEHLLGTTNKPKED